jgi:hypothetical protein
MPLQDRLVTYITKCNGLVSLQKLVSVATGAGFSEDQVLAAIERIGKKLKSTVRGNEVYYQVAPTPKAPTDHLKWVRDNYVRMTPETSADHPAFADLDYSFLFLKPDELLEYKAQAKGMPVRMLQSHGKYKRHG